MTALRSAIWNLFRRRGQMRRCRHGFAPDQGLGLWCPACDR